MQVVFARVGMGTDAWRLVVFVHEWAMAEAQLGERIGVERFAAWSSDSTRTAYRRLADFREAFPELGEHGTPSNMIVWRDGRPAREAVDSIRWEPVAA